MSFTPSSASMAANVSTMFSVFPYMEAYAIMTAFFFRFVAAPCIVFTNDIVEICTPDRAVERADDSDIKGSGFFQDILYLHSVFSHNICVVAAGFIQPVSVKIDLVIENISV